ncbi:MAG TPA: ATP-binding protein [Thermoanaerobaculia bacterium]|jgi:signal transduction histidine kinase
MKQSLLSAHRRGAEHSGSDPAPHLFDSTLVGFASWDENGRLSSANRELCRQTGIERKALEHGAVTIAELIPGVQWQTAGIQERTITRGGTPVTLRIEIDAEARQAFFIDVTEQRAAEQALANARDLLEERAAVITGTVSQAAPSARLQDAQTQLERQQIEIEELIDRVSAAHQELETFSYSVSHDLRTPLRALDGFSRELAETYAPALAPRAQHYVARIRAGAQKLDRIIDDLLRLSRVGRTSMNVVRTDLAAIARTIAADLSAGAPARSVRWTFPDAAPADADRELITLVLQNLLQNAWKFSAQRDDAAIEFRVEETSGRPVYSIRDNGAGFDMRYADKLFAPFQRLHPTTAFEGTGIGLATVKRIIHRHGGQVWAESAPDQGATFSFTLGRNTQGKS